MRGDIIAMSQKERQRYHLMKMVIGGKITLKEASRVMGVSYRHGKRLKRKLATEGARGLIHGNRGSSSAIALSRTLATRIIEPSQRAYTSLHRNDHHWSLEEKLKVEQDHTQVEAALNALGITPIFALTPQAKGRVERLFGVLQDRLIAEMGLRDITDMDAGNRFLSEHFIDDYNHRFARAPEVSQKAWRRVPRGIDIDRIISFHYQAVVGNDNTVRLGGMVIDIPEGPQRRGYAKAKVEVDQLLDGSWRVYYKDTLIAHTDPTPLKEPIRAKPRRRSQARGVSDEQLVYMASAA